MSLLPKILVIGIFIIFFCTNLTFAKRTFSKARYFPNGNVIIDPTSIDETTSTYIFCKESNGQRERKCTVIQDYIENNKTKSFCELDIPYPDKLSRPKLTLLGKDNVVIVSLGFSYHSLRFTSIYLPTCRKIEEKVDLPSQDENLLLLLVTVLSYDDGYEAIFPSSLCKKTFCHVAFDADGKKIEGPSSWIPLNNDFKDYFLFQVSKNSPSERYLLFDHYKQKAQAHLANNKSLKLLTETEVDDYATSIFSYSTSNEFYTTCLKGYAIKCAQFDHNGEAKFNTILPMGGETIIFGSSIHNLPRGGLLVATFNHENESYFIKKFDTEGKYTGKMKRIEFSCNWNENSLQANFFELKTQEYCLLMICSELVDSPDDLGYYEMTANCYTDEDF